MTQYYHLDESGDPGLSGAKGSSSHFVIAMVQLAERAPLPELTSARQALYFSPSFEFKFHKTTHAQRMVFFRSVQPVLFRVRAVVIEKLGLHRYERPPGKRLTEMSGQDFVIEFIMRLTLRASELDIANDVLVIDRVPPAFRRVLRIRLSQECRKLNRVRPFKKIVSGDSRREDGLQLADMIVGAIRWHVVGAKSDYYETFANKIVDLWRCPER